jgi:hypothetical protein
MNLTYDMPWLSYGVDTFTVPDSGTYAVLTSVVNDSVRFVQLKCLPVCATDSHACAHIIN